MSLFGNNSLITRNLGPIPLWRKEMNQLIQKFNNETLNFESTDFLPSLEITEKAKGYTIRAEVPGMRESDINVTLNDNVLVLEGERKSENREEEEGLFSSEFS